MFKTLAPGCIGFGKTFLDAALPAAAHGFEGYWFGLEGDSATPVEQTKEMLSRSGLKAAGFNLTVEFRRELSVFEQGMEKLEDYAHYAAAIGANRCITWLLPSSDTLDYADNFKMHRERLTQICEVLQHYGIRFGMEFIGPYTARRNARYTFIHTLDQTLELCEAIGLDNTGLLLDVWHWDLAGHTRADFAKIKSAEQIILAHINDAPAGVPPDEQMDGVRRLPGETGVLRIADFFDGLKEKGYDGPVMPETFDKTLAALTFDDALKKVMAATQKVWPE